MLQWHFHQGRPGHPDWYSASGRCGHYEIMPKMPCGCEQDLHPKKGTRRWVLFLTPQLGDRTQWDGLTVIEAKVVAEDNETGEVLRHME